MNKKYKIFAALHEEANEGWVWIPKGIVPSGSTWICLKNTQNERKVYCSCRIIDKNFQEYYNDENRRTYKINKNDNHIVISCYYRNKLGLESNYEYELDITHTRNPINWIRALVHHPNNAIQVATCLAIFSIIIGFISIVLSIFTGIISIVVSIFAFWLWVCGNLCKTQDMT